MIAAVVAAGVPDGYSWGHGGDPCSPYTVVWANAVFGYRVRATFFGALSLAPRLQSGCQRSGMRRMGTRSLWWSGGGDGGSDRGLDRVLAVLLRHVHEPVAELVFPALTIGPSYVASEVAVEVDEELHDLDVLDGD